jgi:F0F1-type ATP synthase gamma subunit
MTCICSSSALPSVVCAAASTRNIARYARDHVRRLLADGKTVKILCVGKKGYDILRREYTHR